MDQQLGNPVISIGQYRTASAVVVVGNRHVLLNAMSACQYYGIDTRECKLVISSQSIGHLRQIIPIVSNSVWHSVFPLLNPMVNRLEECLENAALVRFRGISFLHLILKYRLLLKRLFSGQASHSIANIITGYYAEPLERAIHNRFPDARYILVDDGNLTPAINQRRPAEKLDQFKDALSTNSSANIRSAVYRTKLRLLTSIVGVPRAGAKSIEFFTNYELKLAIASDSYTPCPLRKVDGQRINNESIHFLGLPGLSRKIFSRQDYTNLLVSIGSMVLNRKVLYYAHPAETEVDLQMIRKYLRPAKIEINKRPYDVEYVYQSEVPYAVVGFYSSTFASLSSIKGVLSRLVVLKVPMEMFLCPVRKQAVSDIYENLSDCSQIDVLEIAYSKGRLFIEPFFAQADSH